MAVIEQHPYVNAKGKSNSKLVKHYSDEGKTLIQLETGREYEEAIDNYPCEYTYVEKPDEVENANEVPEDETDNSEADSAQ